MRRSVLHVLAALYAICLAAATIWLALVSLFLLATGGIYSRTFPDGSIACGIRVVTSDDWFWPAFRLFGAPLTVAAAARRTIGYCLARLRDGV